MADISDSDEVPEDSSERSTELLQEAHAKLGTLFEQATDLQDDVTIAVLKESIHALLDQMSDAELKSRRTSARALARLFQHKLKQSRRAASLSLEQQAVKLEAQHQQKMRDASAASGSSCANDALSEAIARAESAEQGRKRLKAECDTTAGSLQDALGQLGVALDQNSTLEGLVQEVISSLRSLQHERDEYALRSWWRSNPVMLAAPISAASVDSVDPEPIVATASVRPL